MLTLFIKEGDTFLGTGLQWVVFLWASTQIFAIRTSCQEMQPYSFAKSPPYAERKSAGEMTVSTLNILEGRLYSIIQLQSKTSNTDI